MARSRFALPRGCQNIVSAVGARAFRQLLAVPPATVESACFLPLRVSSSEWKREYATARRRRDGAEPIRAAARLPKYRNCGRRERLPAITGSNASNGRKRLLSSVADFVIGRQPNTQRRVAAAAIFARYSAWILAVLNSAREFPANAFAPRGYRVRRRIILDESRGSGQNMSGRLAADSYYHRRLPAEGTQR